MSEIAVIATAMIATMHQAMQEEELMVLLMMHRTSILVSGDCWGRLFGQGIGYRRGSADLASPVMKHCSFLFHECLHCFKLL